MCIHIVNFWQIELIKFDKQKPFIVPSTFEISDKSQMLVNIFIYSYAYNVVENIHPAHDILIDSCPNENSY